MIWYKYEEHDYMDEKPREGFRLFKDDVEAKQWAFEMNENYSGGSTRLVGRATWAEVHRYVEENHLELDEQTVININNMAYYASPSFNWDLAHDLAFEIQLGGDRFDKHDLEGFLLGVSAADLEEFRNRVISDAREFVPQDGVSSAEENALFVKKSVDSWLKDIVTKEKLDEIFTDNDKISEVFTKIHSAYPYSIDSKRMVTGKLAKEFAGPQFWSKEFSLDVPGFPEVEALTFIDFKDCTNCYLLDHDGEGRLLDSCSKKEQYAVMMGVEDRLKELRSLKEDGIDLADSYFLDRNMLSMMVDDLNRRVVIGMAGETLPEGLTVSEFVCRMADRGENSGTYMRVSGSDRNSFAVELISGKEVVSSFFPNAGSRAGYEKFIREGSVRMFSEENIERIREDVRRFRSESHKAKSGFELK